MISVYADTRFSECDDPNDVTHVFQRRSPDTGEKYRHATAAPRSRNRSRNVSYPSTAASPVSTPRRTSHQ